jgi:hypothetical protein
VRPVRPSVNHMTHMTRAPLCKRNNGAVLLCETLFIEKETINPFKAEIIGYTREGNKKFLESL